MDFCSVFQAEHSRDNLHIDKCSPRSERVACMIAFQYSTMRELRHTLSLEDESWMIENTGVWVIA